MRKRIILLISLVFYAAAVLAVPAPYALPAASMASAATADADGIAAASTHHNCETAAVDAAPVPAHGDGCTDCKRSLSPCCAGMLALPTGFGVQPPAPATADSTHFIALLQPVSRGESIYRPPRA